LFPPVSLQMPPGTWVPRFVEQTPMLMLPLVDSVQWTWPVLLPQHSLSVVQRLLMILQPRPGWQTSMPLSGQGAQILLQQLPQPLQMTPSCWHEPAPVVPGSLQTPTVAPVARWHQPVQQSVSRPQTSPGWMHQEAPSAHLPFVHRPEQHGAVAPASGPHGLPDVAQLLLSVRRRKMS